MTDIFANWKNNRFVVVPHEFLDHDESLIVLTDTSYWNDNFELLKDWCDENNCEQTGMTVKPNNTHALTLFCLRWA
jgi:hypothetical protein